MKHRLKLFASLLAIVLFHGCTDRQAYAQAIGNFTANRIVGGTKPATCNPGPPVDVWIDTTVIPPVLNICGVGGTWNPGGTPVLWSATADGTLSHTSTATAPQLGNGFLVPGQNYATGGLGHGITQFNTANHLAFPIMAAFDWREVFAQAPLNNSTYIGPYAATIAEPTADYSGSYDIFVGFYSLGVAASNKHIGEVNGNTTLAGTSGPTNVDYLVGYNGGAGCGDNNSSTVTCSEVASYSSATTISAGATTGALDLFNQVGAFGLFQQSFVLGGTVPDLANIASYVSLSSSVTNVYAFVGQIDGLSGHATNAYGLKLTDITGASVVNSAITTGVGSIDFGDKVKHYNAIATVDNGVPGIYGHADLTGQTAALSASTLYTPAATGMFRVSFYAKVTTVASISSVLGGTSGFVLNYTDGTDSVAQNLTLVGESQSGTIITIGTGNTGNSTTSIYHGSTVVYAKTGVAMTYNFGYTSSGTAMQYEIHVKVEAL